MNIPLVTARLILALAMAGSAQAAQIAWIASVEQGMKQAHATGKPVLLSFHASWCTWCEHMENNVFHDERVVDRLSGYVCIRVDTDQDSSSAMFYDVRSLPRTLIVNTFDQVIADQTGYIPAEDFLTWLSSADHALHVKQDQPPQAEKNSAPELRRRLAKLTNQQSFPTDILDLMGHRNPAIRKQAAVYIEHQGRQLWLALVEALNHPYLGVRIAAASILEAQIEKPPSTNPWASPEKRWEQVQAWQEWLREQK